MPVTSRWDSRRAWPYLYIADSQPSRGPMLDFGRDTFRFLRDNARWIASGFLLTLFSSFGQTFFIGLSGN
ncbi:hypothetical protein B1A_00058, partial [mine drainage metagenome]